MSYHARLVRFDRFDMMMLALYVQRIEYHRGEQRRYREATFLVCETDSYHSYCKNCILVSALEEGKALGEFYRHFLDVRRTEGY